jgi:DNA-binding FadR family transcriptional regulator
MTADQDTFLEANTRFHQVVARASRNKVLECIWLAISMLAGGEQHPTKYTAANRKSLADAHARIANALRQRDPDTASKLMGEHVGEVRRLSRRRSAAKLTSPTPLFMRSDGHQ